MKYINKIDLSLLFKDSTIVGLENGKGAIGSSNGTNAAAIDGNLVHHFTLNFSNKERHIAYEIKKEKERRNLLGFNESNPWSLEKEAKLKEEERRQQLGFDSDNPWSIEKEAKLKEQ